MFGCPLFGSLYILSVAGTGFVSMSVKSYIIADGNGYQDRRNTHPLSMKLLIMSDITNHFHYQAFFNYTDYRLAENLLTVIISYRKAKNNLQYSNI